MATHSLSAASETFIRSAVQDALDELTTDDEVWAALSDGLDQESLLDLARRVARQHGVSDDHPITLGSALSLALVGQDPDQPLLRLQWDGDRFFPLKDGEVPRPVLERAWEKEVLDRLNTPEAIWERLAKGRSEAEVTELARQTASGMSQGTPIGEVTLLPEQVGAVVNDERGRYVGTLRWNEDLDLFVHYGSEESVLLTLEDLREVCADLY